MKMQRERIAPPTNIGISMLLVVFLVLCLFTFSSIALVQAQNEYDNAVNSAKIRSDYYKAVSVSEKELNELNVKAAAGDYSAGENIIRTYDINANTILTATYTLTPTESGAYYRITDYRTKQTGDWTGNDKLNLVQ